jgi:hypothetical protein
VAFDDPNGQAFPAPQGTHELNDTAPGDTLYVPGKHGKQSTSDVAVLFEPTVPAGHKVGELAPEPQYRPAPQETHELNDTAPGDALNVPDTHGKQSARDVAVLFEPTVPAGHIVEEFAPAPQNLPAPHGTHDADPGEELKVPAGHGKHSMTDAAVLFGPYVPAGQSEQLNAEVAPMKPL